MANWVITEAQGNYQPLATIDTVQRHPLGTIVRAKDVSLDVPLAGEFIYLLGVASTLVGSWVTYDMDEGGTALIVANAIGPVAVAMAANVASSYGWYQIQGKASAQAAAAYADGGLVYIASSGVVDDAVVAGDLVVNAKGASTIVGAGLADFSIARPFVTDLLG